MTLTEFFRDHLEGILSIYEGHERTFDTYGMHGRAHIIRSLLVAEILINYLERFYGKEIQRNHCYFAIAFHDSARIANGPDLWEKESSLMCHQYMVAQGYQEDDTRLASSYIFKKKPIDDCHHIVIDADILEILRIIDIRDFEKDKLYFLNVSNTHNKVIPTPDSLIANFCDYVVRSSGEIAYLALENKLDTSTIINTLIGSLKVFPLLERLFGLKFR